MNFFPVRNKNAVTKNSGRCAREKASGEEVTPRPSNCLDKFPLFSPRCCELFNRHNVALDLRPTQRTNTRLTTSEGGVGGRRGVGGGGWGGVTDKSEI